MKPTQTTKKTKPKKDVLREIETIARNAKGSKFTEEFIASSRPQAKVIASALGCSEIQAILFAVIFNLNFSRPSVDIDQIAGSFDCTPVEIARHIGEMEQLCQLKVLRHDYGTARPGSSMGNRIDATGYAVNRAVLEALLAGMRYKPEPTAAADTFDLLSRISSLREEQENGNLTCDEVEREVTQLVSENRQLPFVKRLMKYVLRIDEHLVLFSLYTQFLDGEENIDFNDLINKLFPGFRYRMMIRQSYVSGYNPLVKKGLVSLGEGHFRTDRYIRLEEPAIDLLLGSDKSLYTKKKGKKPADIIVAGDIEMKQLWYNSGEQQQLDLLAKSLQPDNYRKLQSRLKRAGMKRGFTVLFHGSPGVGKTESVYQIARQTGRDIKMVVISETKSMWFGESEKLIKGVFDSYRREVEKAEVTPILLFNEADGIFGSRKQLGNSPVDQTENAIQNILLQEMENMNGILIATTNLTHNLDRAFERRFLFKIRFEKPTLENRVKIWQDKLQGLSPDELTALASTWEFSGGQIDNIARKALTHKVLNGKPGFEVIEGFCKEEEMVQREVRRMGY
jgi:hypothetical protein